MILKMEHGKMRPLFLASRGIYRMLRKTTPVDFSNYQAPEHTGPVREKLAFILHALDLANHYSPVWDVLPAGSFDIILHSIPDTEDISHLKKWGADIVSSSYLLNENIKYRHMVSNHVIDQSHDPLIKRLAYNNIRFMYAAGKAKWNFADWNKLYDLILCYGPYHAAKFAEITDAKVMQMGYPRFDRFFNDKTDRQKLCADYNCDIDKETIVWLPTWKDLSSVGLYDAEISALTDQYNVVVKLHPLMPESEPERVTGLKKHNFNHIITDNSDNMPLYQLADYMLFDYGGPPMAAVYTNKKMILLNVPDAAADELTGEASPDIELRQHIVNINPGEDKLAHILTDANLWGEQASARQNLRDKYFAPYYGTSSAKAAEILQNLDTLLDKNDEVKEAA